MARIRKGKFLGQEIELDELQASTEAAEATAETIASGAGSADAKSSATAQGARTDENTDIDAAQHEIEEVLREASRSPRIGFVIDALPQPFTVECCWLGCFPIPLSVLIGALPSLDAKRRLHLVGRPGADADDRLPAVRPAMRYKHLAR